MLALSAPSSVQTHVLLLQLLTTFPELVHLFNRAVTNADLTATTSGTTQRAARPKAAEHRQRWLEVLRVTEGAASCEFHVLQPQIVDAPVSFEYLHVLCVECDGGEAVQTTMELRQAPKAVHFIVTLLGIVDVVHLNVVWWKTQVFELCKEQLVASV